MRNPAKGRRPRAARPQAQHTHAGPLTTLTADDRAGEESEAPVELRHSLKGQQPAAAYCTKHLAAASHFIEWEHLVSLLISVLLFYVEYFNLFALFVKGQYSPT